MSKPRPMPPPPQTGGTHVFNPATGAWETIERTIQPYEPEHPSNAVPPPAETPVKEP